MAALTEEQLAALRVHATAAALAYHDRDVPEGERVDLAASFAVHGDLRLVAADVLEAACLHLQGVDAAGATERVKRFRVEGQYEEEYFAGASTEGVSAAAWCARAERLRAEVKAEKRTGGLIRSPLAGMLSGGSGAPVFRITRSEVET